MFIGLFDSGIGGLTVLKALIRDLPNYTYVYYGDNANAPYGEKSPEEIYDLTIKGIEFLFAKNCSLVVLACNTASTVLPHIQQNWLSVHYPDRKVLGIIRPTAEHMVESGEKEIYLMATPATVNAHSYEKELVKLQTTSRVKRGLLLSPSEQEESQKQKQLPSLHDDGQGGLPAVASAKVGCGRDDEARRGASAQHIVIHPIPAPGLAKAIEDSGGKTNKIIKKIINKLLGDLSTKFEMTHCERSLYLACTHYEWVEDEIRKQTDLKVISQSSIASSSLKGYLSRHDELALEPTPSRHQPQVFFSSETNLPEWLS